ncbi:hypothetical protein [Salibacter halophilus]|uniref:DUF3575 domain-containing protein n=1 Tax=Salibacter halophilus TaxID=1803916 RepID=A0A6N6M8P5_9FLAO|nr:hypothetical protein [Salibacter halophilus]KAB1064464.1 hypothetical protein F3059_07130 [Salibacter halophilus]
MKKLFFTLLLISLGSSVIAQNYYDSNDKKKVNSEKPLNEFPRENIMSIEPVSFFIGGFVMGYERFLTNTSSLKFRAGYYYREDAGIYNGYNYFEGFNLKVNFKKYINDVHENESTIYISPYALYKQITLEENNMGQLAVPVTREASTASVGVMVGTIIGISETPFFIDVALGGGMFFPIASGSHDEAHLGFVNHYKKGVGPQLDFAFGYSF